MRDYFQSNHLQEFLAGKYYLLILKVPNNNSAKQKESRTVYLSPENDKFGRSIYLSIIFFLKISLESSGN